MLEPSSNACSIVCEDHEARRREAHDLGRHRVYECFETASNGSRLESPDAARRFYPSLRLDNESGETHFGLLGGTQVVPYGLQGEQGSVSGEWKRTDSWNSDRPRMLA